MTANDPASARLAGVAASQRILKPVASETNCAPLPQSVKLPWIALAE